ncbi:hypothetical protein P691DRAFT_769938 [Macrolepiota fuliginosa MF-IS2]|uniref:Endonuclease/exonuclease/phosphatase domain-containing protein n=1 Tax=Macrolepiota fuliginosa MF-IS2 TaxID=1400762 RepID=A0A9P5WWZ4_9AGAR|nr:hypothetical protein P691DRAFT_769938 [Macrolepiota fuliginosa MF-IS2]
MGGDFNTQSTDWDPGAATRPRSAKLLLELASDLGLDLGIPLVPGPTRFPFNGVDRPSVINLMFVPTREGHALRLNIDLSLRGTLDHAPLVVRVPIIPERFMVERRAMKKDSEELELFLAEVSIGLGNLQGMLMGSPDQIETVASAMGDIILAAWRHHSSEVKLCLRSKSWWDNDCSLTLQAYRSSRQPEDWKEFRRACKTAKHVFFDARIEEIATTNKLLGFGKSLDFLCCY